MDCTTIEPHRNFSCGSLFLYRPRNRILKNHFANTLTCDKIARVVNGGEIMNMIKSWRFWIGLVISLICLVLAFQGIQFDKLWQALVGMNYAWLSVGLGIWFISYAGRAYRWQLLFAPQHLRWSKVFNALSIGYFLSNILPGRVGDLVRAFIIGQMEGVSKVRSLSTVVVERLMDGLAVVFFFGLTGFFVPNLPNEARQGALGVAVVGVGGIVFLLALTFQKERGMALLHRIASPFSFLNRPGLWHMLESLIDGFAVLRSPRPIFGVLVWSLYVWITGGLVFWFVMFATGLVDAAGAPLPISAAFLVMTVTSLVVVVPSSPGYLGIFHFWAQVTLTTIYGVDKTTALSYAIVVHATSYLWLMVVGVYAIAREGFSFSRLQSIEEQSVKSEA